MSWNIIILLVLIGAGAVFGLFRGAKQQGIRLVTVLLAIAVSVGISVGIAAAAGNFQLLSWIDPAKIQESGFIDALKQIVPFYDKVAPVLNTVFFGSYSSVLLSLIIFLLVNKLFTFLYHLLANIGHKTDKLAIQSGKKKLTFHGGVASTIFGAILGAIQGFVIACFIFAPICEIISYFPVA